MTLRIEWSDSPVDRPFNFRTKDIIDFNSRYWQDYPRGSIEALYVAATESGLTASDEVENWIKLVQLYPRKMNKGQLACLAVLDWDLEAERAKQRTSDAVHASHTGLIRAATKDTLARQFGVSAAYIQKARNLWLNNRDGFDAVVSGRLTLTQATRNVGLSNG